MKDACEYISARACVNVCVCLCLCACVPVCASGCDISLLFSSRVVSLSAAMLMVCERGVRDTTEATERGVGVVAGLGKQAKKNSGRARMAVGMKKKETKRKGKMGGPAEMHDSLSVRRICPT